MGDGRDVFIGTDPISGISESHYFVQDLRSYLSDYGITSLHHARNTLVHSQAYWLFADDLELGG